jgi:Lipocalin-like domain
MKLCSPTGLFATALFAGSIALIHSGAAMATDTPMSLTGTWTLVSADVIHADGSRGHDYGDNPKGMLVIDSHGRYSLQILSDTRVKFATGDKKTGTDAEFKSAVMGISSHFGTINIDTSAHVLTFNIDVASFPNWDGTEQKRNYELTHDELSYRVPPRPNGDVPVSIWRKAR